MIEMVERRENGARLKVVGVGGGGGNALNTMIRAGLSGVEFIAANTDSQALCANLAPHKLLLGPGLGAGKIPEVGKKYAEEYASQIEEALKGSDMIFITAGMGGGTGTGASPVIARIARETGALCVAVVTLPFDFEGKKRKEFAQKGLEELKENVDSLILVPNQRLIQLVGKTTPLKEAFLKVDEILLHAVRGIVDLITVTGLVNVDFADVKTIMSERGMALMGSGEAEGEDRATSAAHNAISNPLLENIRIEGARGVLINITGPEDLTLSEVAQASEMIRQECHESAMIIFGAVIDEKMGSKVRVTVIATGFEQFDAKAFRNLKGLSERSSSSSLEIPTIIRRRQMERESLNRTNSLSLQDEDEEKYDIPTFLRRQSD